MFRSESSISSKWQCTGVSKARLPVPRELLPPHVGRCRSSVTSIFQPPPSRRTTTSSQHARPSGVLRRRSDGLECDAWRPPRPVAQCRQFQEDAKDASVSECTSTFSALEALHTTLFTFWKGSTIIRKNNESEHLTNQQHETLKNALRICAI